MKERVEKKITGLDRTNGRCLEGEQTRQGFGNNCYLKMRALFIA